MTNKKTKKSKREKENFFKKNFKEGLSYTKTSKNFIYAVSAVFVLFVLIGYFIPAPAFVEEIISKFIEELIKMTEGMSWADLTKFILSNNLKSSFLGMALGIVFGIFSVMTALVNGYVLGFVASKVASAEGIAVLWKLLPHGVFELPALLISMGLGLRLGTFIFKKKKLKTFKEFSVQSLRAFIFVVLPLLVIAALIEATLIFLVN